MIQQDITQEYIRRRMEELGYGTNYYLRIRQLVLKPSELRQIAAENELWLLLESVDMVSIESDFGFYDLSAFQSNELQWEHQGTILIRNHAATLRQVQFIQIIPK